MIQRVRNAKFSYTLFQTVPSESIKDSFVDGVRANKEDRNMLRFIPVAGVIKDMTTESDYSVAVL